MAEDIVIIQPIVPVVEITSPGPQGPAGQFSPGDVAYTHIQNTPSAIWTINHNLGFNPIAVVLDSGGTQCEGAVSYPTVNQMIINFTGAFSGTAYLV